MPVDSLFTGMYYCVCCRLRCNKKCFWRTIMSGFRKGIYPIGVKPCAIIDLKTVAEAHRAERAQIPIALLPVVFNPFALGCAVAWTISRTILLSKPPTEVMEFPDRGFNRRTRARLVAQATDPQ
jgi:hypothetical protein